MGIVVHNLARITIKGREIDSLQCSSHSHRLVALILIYLLKNHQNMEIWAPKEYNLLIEF